MNRLFATICGIVLLMCNACQDNAINLDNQNGELTTRAAGMKFRQLVQQARTGDADAYKSLAICYRDGDGVEKSWLNMICMYANYCDKTGENFNSVVELFEEGHPFRKVTEILSSSYNRNALKELEQLEMHIPAEAKVIKAVGNNMLSEEIPDSTLRVIREAENEGSELAALFQIAYYEEKDRKDEYEQCLIRLAGKYPFLNLKIGKSYIGRYWESKDFSDIQKAIEYYYKADAYAMLTPRYANGLISIYRHFGKKGMVSCDEQEMERLKKIANIKD
ncbi:MAG: hypothetical protein IJX44_08905 [Bacteroidaceae bacterium]|nr:hypothetical protein [Bacteroidaceae bacterium]